jgi:hypothetical protein
MITKQIQKPRWRAVSSSRGAGRAQSAPPGACESTFFALLGTHWTSTQTPSASVYSGLGLGFTSEALSLQTHKAAISNYILSLVCFLGEFSR